MGHLWRSEGRRQRKFPTISLQFIPCNRKFKGATNSGNGAEKIWRARKLFRLQHHLGFLVRGWETTFWRWAIWKMPEEILAEKLTIDQVWWGQKRKLISRSSGVWSERMRKLQLRKWGNYSARKWRIMTSSFPGPHCAIHYSDPCSMSAPTKHNEIRITANFSPFCPIQNQGQGYGHLHTFLEKS